MSGSTALVKINKRVKQLQKKHPNAKRTTLQKQAGREYRNGTMPKPRKKAAKKSRPRKRAAAKKVTGKRKYKVTHRVKRIATVGTVRRHRKRAKPKAHHRPRRVGASGKSMVPMMLGVAAVGVLAYMLLKPKTPALPVALAPSTSVARNAAASNILQYASAAGAGINALTALVNALNNMSDSAVVTASAQMRAGTPIDVAVPGGPSINAGNLVYNSDDTNYATI